MKIRDRPCMAAVIVLFLASCGRLFVLGDVPDGPSALMLTSPAYNGNGAALTHAFYVRSARG